MGALDGVRVVDFGQYIAGPLLGTLLADAGAAVVHVDPPGGPRWQTPANAVLLRGRQTVELDLKRAEGLTEARRLVAGADVLIEGFRPGVMERLGLGADRLLAENPALVYCSLPGFPSDDPRGRQGMGGRRVGGDVGVPRGPRPPRRACRQREPRVLGDSAAVDVRRGDRRPLRRRRPAVGDRPACRGPALRRRLRGVRP